MSRKTIQKNLSYDDRRHLYYVVLRDGTDSHGRRTRRTKTYSTYGAALEALTESTASSLAEKGLSRTHSHSVKQSSA